MIVIILGTEHLVSGLQVDHELAGKGLNARSQQIFLKGQTVNIVGFIGHVVSVTTRQLCCYRMKSTLGG